MSPQEYLKLIDSLPESANVPIAVAALHDGVCERTVRRNYPLIKVSTRRNAVNVGYLRRRKAQNAS